jgi:hypothetical protein
MEEVPFQDRTVPKVEVDWDRSLWWWYPVSRAIHPAIRMTSLLWSLIAVLLLRAGVEQAEKWFATDLKSATFLDWISGPTLWSSKFTTVSQNFRIPQLTIENVAFMTFAVVWIALISSAFGGVLARRAAVELGQRTIAPWYRSIRLVSSRIVSYLWAAGMHFIAIGGLLLPFLILGWLSRFGSVAALITGVLLLLLSLPLMFAIGRLFLSLTVCYPLSVCAISIEKRADAFEGFSRSNAYFFQRPVLAFLTVILLVVCGEIGALLVSWVVYSGWGLIEQTYLATSTNIDPAVKSYLSIGNWLATSLVLAYRFSYFWSAAAGLYLVLRRCVDSTDLDEMEVCESELEQNPPMIPTTSQPAGATPSSSAPSVDSDPPASGSSDEPGSTQ